MKYGEYVELCLAIAGYHPATLAATGGPTYDYWLLEGLLSFGDDYLAAWVGERFLLDRPAAPGLEVAFGGPSAQGLRTQDLTLPGRLEAAVDASLVPVVCDPSRLRVMFAVDVSGQGKDGNGAAVTQQVL